MDMGPTEQNLMRSLHLSRYEAKMYLAGLTFEEASLTELARGAGIPRTAAYPPVKKLLERGFMSSVKIGKRVHYRSLDPKYLPSVLEREKTYLEEVIQELAQRIDAPTVKTSVQYFPGIHGIETAIEIFLNMSNVQLWKTIENPEHVLGKMKERGLDIYIERRVQKNIRARVIIPGNQQSRWVKRHVENAEKDLNDILIVSPELYPIKSNLAIAGDTIIMLDANVIPFAIVIKNAHLARTLESLHDIAWDRYKK